MSSQASPRCLNLVVGLAGPYGAGCSSSADSIAKHFEGWPKTKTHIVKVSQLIELYYPLVFGNPLDSHDRGVERRKVLQTAGTKLRQRCGAEFLAKCIAAQVCTLGSDDEESGEPSLLVFVIDSLKNEIEIRFLQNLYGGEFYLVFIAASQETRWEREKIYGHWRDRAEFDSCDIVDSDESQCNASVGDAGQQVRKLAWLSDYHVVNESNKPDLSKTTDRFVDLLMGGSKNQPRRDEHAMHLAFSASNRSFCLSRQVGAALFDIRGNLLSVGYNDVPKPTGGLYTEVDEAGDCRCYVTGDTSCQNDAKKAQIFAKLDEIIGKRCELDMNSIRQYWRKYCQGIQESVVGELIRELSGYFRQCVSDAVRESSFKDVTEYCRAVHAEMEALIGACRAGANSTAGGTVYVTTEPCHNCIKHLIAAGIAQIVYIDPYPKSLATSLHPDAITTNPKGSGDKVRVRPYSGVAPRRYHDFFEMQHKRKNREGKYCEPSVHCHVDHPHYTQQRVGRRSRLDGTPDRVTTSELMLLREMSSMLHKPQLSSVEGS